MSCRSHGLPRRCAIACVLAAMTIAVAVQARAADATPEGFWYAEGGAAQVEIRSCGDALCGRVVWLRSPFDENGCDLLDRYNPDPALRARPIIGLEILSGLQAADGPESWGAGAIYDPTSGNTYRAALTMDGADRVRIRGYLGIPLIGRTTTWVRVGAEGRMCRAAHGGAGETNGAGSGS